MSTIVPGVIQRRSNLVTLTANVSNVNTALVGDLKSATSNVVLADAVGQLVLSNLSQTVLSYLSGVTSPIQQQLDSKSGLGSNLLANNITVSNNLTLGGQTASRALATDASGVVVTTAVTGTELGYLSGVTSAVQTQLNARANLTGATFSGAVTLSSDLIFPNKTASRVLTTDASGAVVTAAVTTTEIGYVIGVTSGIQTQLNARANLTGATFSGPVALSGQTASRVAVFDSNKALANSVTTTTELGYLSGVTSAVQTQLDARANLTGATFSGPVALSGQTASRVAIFDTNKALANSVTTAAELAFLSGTTSAVQTQLDARANLTGATFSGTVALSAQTASRVAVFDANKALANSVTTTAELGYLSGTTSSVQTQLNARANIAGATFSGPVALSGQTASRVAVFDGSSALANSVTTTAELGYLSGTTSSVQTQLNAKQATITGAASSVTSTNLNASIVVVSDANGKIASAATTTTQLGYLNNLTSDLKTQLDSKANVGSSVSFDALTVTGNLTVLGNTTLISTEQLVVEDPLLVLNTERLAQPTGLYLQQSGNSNVAVVYQNGNLEVFSTGTQPNATSLSVAAYLPIRTGLASVTGLTVKPTANGFMTAASTGFDGASTTHTFPASTFDVAGGGIFAGQLMFFVTNSKTDSTNKTGFATVSLLKTPPDFDVVPISVHRNVNLGTLDIGKSIAGTDVVVVTDSDCRVGWKFDGSGVI